MKLRQRLRTFAVDARLYVYAAAAAVARSWWWKAYWTGRFEKLYARHYLDIDLERP